MMYDIAILGLGPAGAALARLIGDDFKVVAIDKKGKTQHFRKPCGGLLAESAQKALSKMGLVLPKDILVDPQIFAVHTLDMKTGLSRLYQRCYVNIDRHKFDLWLREGIHADIFEGKAYKVEQNSVGYTVHFEQNGEKKAIEAKYIVGADGANSLVRKMLYSNKHIRSYTAIQEWYADTQEKPLYFCLFDEKNTDCYSWGISKDGCFIFGGAYPQKYCSERFNAQKNALIKMGYNLRNPIKREACVVLRPSRFRDFCCGENGAFLIGEAAGFISPSSLEGISWALESAMSLADALVSENPNRKYIKNTLKIRLKLRIKELKCPFMYNPVLRRLVMKSGIRSVEAIQPSASLLRESPETR